MASPPRGLLLSASAALEAALAPRLGALERTAEPEALVARFADDPTRLVLLDLAAPFEAALEGLARYGAATRRQPVAVALARAGDEAALRRAAELGVLDYLRLPLEPLELEVRLQLAGRRLRLAGELALRTASSRAGEERLRFALSQMPVSLSVVDRAGRVLFAAGGPVHPDALPAEAREGRVLAELYGRAPEAMALFRRALAGERFTEALAYPGGRSEVTLVPSAHDEAGVAEVTVLSRDITRQARADEERERTERFWREVLDALPTSVSIMDGGRMVYANAATSAVLGLPREALAGRAPDQLGLSPGQAAALARENAEVVAEGREVFVPEVRMGRPPRRYQVRKVPVTTLGGSRAVLGVAEDVTATREALAAQQRAEGQLKEVLERSLDLVTIYRGPQLIYVNPATARLMGLTREALVGLDVQSFIHPDDWAEAVAREASAANAPNPAARFRIRPPGGRELTVESVSMPVTWEGELAVMSVSRDVTEEVRLQQQLLVADRLASLGTLAAGVAHEINNPLAYLYANLGFARAALGPGADPELVQALDDARDGAERVKRIVGDLKAFARPDESGEAAEVGRAVRAALQLCEHELRHRARVEVELGPAPGVRGSEGRLTQVVLNLLVNAAQALPEDQPDRQRIGVRTGTDARGWAVLEVWDTGPGIPPELRGRLFDPFFTTKPVGRGLGLGLSVCHGLVRALGGEIGFETELGRGTTFRVALPPGEPRPAPARAPGRAPARRGRLLLVDDEPLVSEALRRALGREHEVAVCRSAQEALGRLEAGERYDLVLCDLMMPGMTGMELHAELGRRGLGAERVAFMTGGAFTASAQEFLERVPNARLEKPFAFAEVEALLARALDGNLPG